MSVLGIGTDLVATARIDEILCRHRERFLARCFRPYPSGELSDPWRVAGLAGRWAAKEAFLKALGQDVGSIPYRDIEVVDPGSSKAKLVLHGRALDALNAAGDPRVHLAISSQGPLVLAMVLLEA